MLSLNLILCTAPLTEQSTEYMTIVNNAEHNIAFKVKTTAPKFYCVRPNAAVVAPGESVEIQVIFLGLAEEPAPNYNCRDKFLVITLPAPEDLNDKSVAEVWSTLEADHGKQAVSKKIKVKYLTTSEQSTTRNVVQESQTERSVEEPKIHDSTAETKATEEINEKPALLEKTEDVESKENTDKATNETPKHESSMNLAPLLIIVLVAFLIRWFYN